MKILRVSATQQSLERESNRSDSKMRARHLLSCLTDGEILVLLSSQSVELVHGMLSIHFCILLPKSNWSLLLSCSPAGLSLPARGCSVFPITAQSRTRSTVTFKSQPSLGIDEGLEPQAGPLYWKWNAILVPQKGDLTVAAVIATSRRARRSSSAGKQR